MTIEFHTPVGKVTEKLIGSVRSDLLGLVHINKKITRAEVMMKEEAGIHGKENKVCEIRLSIFGDNTYVRSRTDSFDKSAKMAIDDLKRLVEQQVVKGKEHSGIVAGARKR